MPGSISHSLHQIHDMKFTKKIFLLICLFSQMGISAFANDSTGVIFSYKTERLNNNEAVFIVHAKIAAGIKLYSTVPGAPDAPASTFSFDSSIHNYLVNGIIETPVAIKEKDPMLGVDVQYLTDSATWKQIFKLSNKDSLYIKGIFSYLEKKGDEYLPFEEKIHFLIPAQETQLSAIDQDDAPINGADKKSLWWIFLTAFGGGLLALLTPCVYSMIPVTVSFFTKRSKTPIEGRKNAIWYAISIILIFTLLGFLITIIFGPSALNKLASNWIANLVFFAVFLIFGISFLGAFDISLPASWSTGVDKKASISSFSGIFFMALTLVVVSFSCTGPIIGNLLVLAAKGNFYGPLMGMFGFSLALALPFALFAFFPSKLSVLGKAGGWLNAIKVTLGFLELALALKFLSNADLSKGWRLLDREIYLSLWIVIFILLGVYLLGKLKFHHDDELPKNDFGVPYLSVTRLFFAIAAFAFSVYLVPGLWGAPLKGVSAFLPPLGTQDYIGNTNVNSAANQNTAQLPAPVKYFERMHVLEPEVVKKFGMITYFDFNEAKAVAKKVHKPLMLDFTGITCVNCRKMEAGVWSNPEVMKRLKEDFVIASLYVDVHDIEIPLQEQYESKALGERIETLGDLNSDIQVTQFGANAQPFYFFINDEGKRLRPEGYGYDPDVQKFIKMLDEVKVAYEKQKAD